jgi:precorrin-2 dehydrogenase/sirohydrochlorin ferrochelatase
LIVGGGNVGLEKLTFMLKSSPNANVEVVVRVLPELVELVNKHDLVKLTMKKIQEKMLKKRHMVIVVPMILK